MSGSPVIVPVESLEDATRRIDELAAVYRRYGAVIVPGLMRGDERFVAYERDIKTLMMRLLEHDGHRCSADDDVDELVTHAASVDRSLVGTIYDIGTRPIKLLSGTLLKTHPFVLSLVRKLFEGGPLAFPYLGETLHVFPPGIENERYNLPIHQDYHSLMQSSDQISAYFNFGRRRSPDVGGIRFWLGSHAEGVRPAKRTDLGHWQVVLSPEFESRYPAFDYTFDYGDFALFDSLLQHSGIKNRSEHTRLFQLVRYSNLAQPDSVRFRWQSAQRDGRGVSFTDVHPTLVEELNGKQDTQSVP